MEPDIVRMKKTELHQHVDGSIPVAIVWELMLEHRLNPVESLEEMEKLLILQEEEEGNLLTYLDKFHYPMWITQFYENIIYVTQSIVAEAAANNVRLLELRYSPIIHTYAGLTLRQAIRAVLSGMNKAKDYHPIEVGLVVIAMRQHGPHIAKILAKQAISEAQQFHHRSGVVGFDIAGAEKGHYPRLFKEAFQVAGLGKLGLTAHVGEDEGPECVWEAIDELGVTRLGHACSAVRDKNLLQRLAKDRILVECCLTSNYQTGAVKKGERHPILTFLEYGIPVAICTDNPMISATNQNRENSLLLKDLSMEQLAAIHAEAEKYTFIQR